MGCPWRWTINGVGLRGVNAHPGLEPNAKDAPYFKEAIMNAFKLLGGERTSLQMLPCFLDLLLEMSIFIQI